MSNNRDYSFIETKSGLEPDFDYLSYQITTKKVEDYLQRKFSIITKQLNKNDDVNINDFEIQVKSIEASKTFIPFMILMPTDVLYSNIQKKKNTDDDEYEDALYDIYNDDDAPVKIIKQYYNSLAMYAYTQDEAREFRKSQKFVQSTGVRNPQVRNFLARMRVPRFMSHNDGNDSKIALLLKPENIFYDMLLRTKDLPNAKNGFKNKKDKFDIELETVKKLSEGMFEYRVVRNGHSKKNKNKFDNDNAMRNINRMLRRK